MEMVASVGDARHMPFETGSFDVCFSNSVIEHVGTYGDQMAMAGEVARVGKSYFVQTPNRWFPLEPHFLVPGWQFLPLTVRASLHQSFRLGWIERQPDAVRARAEVEQIRLMTRGELRHLFKEARIEPEWFGPFVKSWIAVKSY